MVNDSNLKSKSEDAASVSSPTNAMDVRAAISTAEEAVLEDAPETSEAVVVASDTNHSRSPDFLDMCCGDPLELERHIAATSTKEEKKN